MKNAIQKISAGQKVKIKGLHTRVDWAGNRISVDGDFKFNSCASYALEYNECPIKSYMDAIKNGHATHWAIPLVCSIDGRPYVKPIITVEVGDVVYFEGRNFKINPENNDNVKLTEVKKESVPVGGVTPGFGGKTFK